MFVMVNGTGPGIGVLYIEHSSLGLRCLFRYRLGFGCSWEQSDLGLYIHVSYDDDACSSFHGRIFWIFVV